MDSEVIIDEDILKVADSQKLKEKFTEVIPIGKIKELPAGSKDEEGRNDSYEMFIDILCTDIISQIELLVHTSILVIFYLY